MGDGGDKRRRNDDIVLLPENTDELTVRATRMTLQFRPLCLHIFPTMSCNPRVPAYWFLTCAFSCIIAQAQVVKPQVTEQPPPPDPYLITTTAGGGILPTPAAAINSPIGYPNWVAASDWGNVYFASGNRVFMVDKAGTLVRIAGQEEEGFGGDGGPAVDALLDDPQSIVVDHLGNLYIGDGSFRIRRVGTDGIITTVAGTGVFGYTGDNGPAIDAQITVAYGMAVDAAGNLFFSDLANYAVREIALDGTITTVAGTGVSGYSGDNGPATSGMFSELGGVAVDASGTIYICDDPHIRRVKDGIITTFAGNGTSDNTGDGGPAINAALRAFSLAVDAAGNVFVSTGYLSIRKITVSTGIITTATKQVEEPRGIAIDASGRLLVAGGGQVSIVGAGGGITPMAGNGDGTYPGDGGPATNSELSGPAGVATDSTGNLYISDTGNQRVRKVDANGTISTLATVGGPSGLLVAPDGTVLVADTLGGRIAAIDALGQVTTRATVSSPLGLTRDTAGNLFASMPDRSEIVKIDTSGQTSIFAGNGTQGYGGDTGYATAAELSQPEGVFADSGNLYIADLQNNRVRKVDVNGVITTVAGDGSGDWLRGDHGPATNADVGDPTAITFDGQQQMFIATGALIRKVDQNGIITALAGTRGRTIDPLGDYGDAYDSRVDALPSQFAWDTAGGLYFADSGDNRIRLLIPINTRALLSATLTHSERLRPGQNGATWTITVSNTVNAGSTNGQVAVTEMLPSTLALVSMSGSGWSCSSVTCQRSDALNGGSSYPPITVTVHVDPSANYQVMNLVKVSGGGAPPMSVSSTATLWGSLSLGVAPPSAGAVTATPASPDGSYPTGTHVCLTATPASGFLFGSWTGTPLDAGNCLLIGVSSSVAANFGKNVFKLTLTASPANTGSVTTNPTAAGNIFAPGTKVCLTAKPDTGYYFLSWTGAPVDAQNCLIINSATSVKVTFAKPFTLTTTVNPLGSGKLTMKPTATRGTYIPLTKVCITTVPATGYVFSGWSGTKLDASNCIVMTSNASVTAKFARGYLLTIKVTPSGSGTVTADPLGVNHYYLARTNVCLTPAPKAHYAFKSWSGATMNGNCVAMKSNVTVTATFVKTP